MSEIYWITRLDYIQGLAIAGLVVGLFLLLVWIVVRPVDDCDEIEMRRGLFRWMITIMVTSSVALTFIPSTKEMLLIWAAGGSLEYITNNETIKQLPDKCVQAIDALLNEYIGESNGDESYEDVHE